MTPHTPQLLRCAAVLSVTGLTRSALYRMLRNGEFPAPVRLGPRSIAWRAVDLAEWADGLPRVKSK